MGIGSKSQNANYFNENDNDLDGSGEQAYDSDEEDTNLKSDDVMCLVASTEEDYSTLEVWVYEPKVSSNSAHLTPRAQSHHKTLLLVYEFAMRSFQRLRAFRDRKPCGFNNGAPSIF